MLHTLNLIKKCFSYKNGVEIFINPSKYEIKEEPGKVKLIIKKLNINDTANYTVVASNKDDEKTLTFDLRKKGKDNFQVLLSCPW